ncbi:MAG: radical SAM family heme chaperone HemW, partial [Enterobacteriaceae bacterium]
WHINQQGEQLLQEAGYQQYEISAYAKAGHQCQHNLNYWRFGDYLAIGCGAHSKLTQSDGTILRQIKVRHPKGYMQGNYLSSTGEVPVTERPFEFFLNRFRLLEPVPRQALTHLTGVPESHIRPQIEAALTAGYLQESPESWQVTHPGHLYLNSLLQLFLTD